MKDSDGMIGKAGLTRRLFGRFLAAGLGAAALLPKVKGVFRRGPGVSFREASFYEPVYGPAKNKQDRG